MTLEDSIVNACIDLYNNLPKTGKCKAEEWSVISAVVGVFDSTEIKVLSLGTGSKCIGQSSMSSKGDILNDSHAEVIARRAFIRYLLLQIIKLNESDSSDIFYRECGESIKVKIKKTVKFYFVTSMSPCGDASIMPKDSSEDCNSDLYGECLISLQQAAENHNRKRKASAEELDSKKIKTTALQDCGQSDIHRTGAKCLSDSIIQDPHLPGALYHNTGALRTKPGRGDPTLSLSCSDKIARWNAIGWQGALLSFFITTPVFIDGIICGGNTPFSKHSFNRAVNDRIEKCPPINIQQSQIPFPESKMKGKRPSPSSIIWCDSKENNFEVSSNGHKLGVTKKNMNKKIARTFICKKELFILFERAVSSFENHKKFLEDLVRESESKSLKDIKYGELKLMAKEYQQNWEAVKSKHFKLWCNKPKDLLNFTVND